VRAATACVSDGWVRASAFIPVPLVMLRSPMQDSGGQAFAQAIGTLRVPFMVCFAPVVMCVTKDLPHASKACAGHQDRPLRALPFASQSCAHRQHPCHGAGLTPHLANQTKPKPRDLLVILSIMISALAAPCSLNSAGHSAGCQHTSRRATCTICWFVTNTRQHYISVDASSTSCMHRLCNRGHRCPAAW
jgi:hypothetical protein